MSTSSGGPEVHLHKEDECDPLVIGKPLTAAQLLKSGTSNTPLYVLVSTALIRDFDLV